MIKPWVLLPLAAAALASGAGQAAEAPRRGGIGNWAATFYAPPAAPDRPPVASGLPDEAACVGAILAAERDHGIPDHMLLAVGFTEAGRRTSDGLFTVWPWTVMAEGNGRFFPTRGAAIDHVRGLLARGIRSIDVGCLQVNLRWHPDAFPDLETAFDPEANVRYAARYLASLQRDHGALSAAIGRYHSAQAERQELYRARVNSNLRWVGSAIGYLEALATAPAADTFAWGRAERSRLAFLASLYTNGPARPLLPDHRRD